MKKIIAALTAGSLFLVMGGMVFAWKPCCSKPMPTDNIHIVNEGTMVMGMTGSIANSGLNGQMGMPVKCPSRTGQHLKTGVARSEALTMQTVNYTDMKLVGQANHNIHVTNLGTAAIGATGSIANSGLNGQMGGGSKWMTTGSAVALGQTSNGANVVSVIVR